MLKKMKAEINLLYEEAKKQTEKDLKKYPTKFQRFQEN